MIKRFLFTTLFFGVIANAETISLSPINDGRGTIGTLSGFMVVNGSIAIGNSGNVDILLNYNYETPGGGGPSTDLGARVRTSIFGRGRNLGEFGRTLSEREDLTGKCL